ncbi:MAG: M15 family metallopeptidase [Burkholderiaceae bacterium]|nr:M15 family metallopeptidase [Burkholderiaceae bacterium]
MASRALDDLAPDVAHMARLMLGECAKRGLDVIVICTWRSAAEQAYLWESGRSRPGPILTNARPGQSLHNCIEGARRAARAFDVVPMRAGRPVWGTAGDDLKLWQAVGRCGLDVGLEWAGEWEKMREFPHFQKRGAA